MLFRSESLKDNKLSKLQLNYETLYNKYKDLQDEYVLATQTNEVEEISTRIQEDSQKVKEFQPHKHTSKKKIKRVKWSKREVGIITYAASRPEGESNRNLSNMLNKLTNRTRDALATKINEMGYSCKNGYMVGKIKCLMNT